MYVIMNEDGEMFAGQACGCVVTKRHWTRAYIYQTRRTAEKDLSYFDLEGFTIEELDQKDNGYINHRVSSKDNKIENLTWTNQ